MEIAPGGRRRGHHHVGILGEAGDGQIGLDPAARVQPLGIDGAPRCHGDIGRCRCAAARAPHRHHGPGIWRRSIDRTGDLLAGCLHLGRAMGEPVLALEAVLVFRRHAVGREPIGPLPTRDLAEAGAVLLEPHIERRQLDAACRLVLAIGPMHGIEQTQRLGDAVIEIGLAVLMRRHAADVDIPEVEGRMAAGDPFGERHARHRRPIGCRWS